MWLINRSNKVLVSVLVKPPIWPESIWPETPSWAFVHFSCASSPPPFLSWHTGPQSEIRRAFSPKASHFFLLFWLCFDAIAFIKWMTTVHSKKCILFNYLTNQWVVSENKFYKTILFLVRSTNLMFSFLMLLLATH